MHEGLLVGSIVTASGIYEVRPRADRSYSLTKVDRSSLPDCGGAIPPATGGPVSSSGDGSGFQPVTAASSKAPPRVEVLGV